ncbi:hypothetical protein QQP08_019974 [Theobroma cacao]|nr:hypothetical protein QQP08_019974 [Theobroma cacao]
MARRVMGFFNVSAISTSSLPRYVPPLFRLVRRSSSDSPLNPKPLPPSPEDSPPGSVPPLSCFDPISYLEKSVVGNNLDHFNKSEELLEKVFHHHHLSDINSTLTHLAEVSAVLSHRDMIHTMNHISKLITQIGTSGLMKQGPPNEDIVKINVRLGDLSHTLIEMSKLMNQAGKEELTKINAALRDANNLLIDLSELINHIDM